MVFWSAANVILGALSFYMLAGGALFWVGFASAVAALVLGTLGKKSTVKSRQICALAGIILAVAGAVTFMVFLYAAGYRYVEIL